MKEIQDTSIGAVYELIRDVNHEVAKLARELIEKRESAKSDES